MIGRPTWLLVVLLVGSVLVASGCTARQSKSDYESRLEQAVATRSAVNEQLDQRALRTQGDYDAAAAKVRSALEELDADAPPRDVESAHQRMVEGMEGLVALLARTGRCEGLVNASEQDAKACRQSIDQSVFDQIRNDFGEADTIYGQEGYSVPGLSGTEGHTGDGDQLDEGATDGGDEL